MPEKGLGIKLRGIYAKPWTRIARNVRLPPSVLRKIGKILVKEVVLEAKKQRRDQGNRSTPRGEPEGLPKGPEFYKSFRYKVRGSSTIEIWSDWPVIEQLIDGRDEYQMTWLTRAEGVNAVPMKQRSGRVIVRATPLRRSDAWIHPGFAKHDFVTKGIENAREEVAKILIVEVAKQYSKGDPTR